MSHGVSSRRSPFICDMSMRTLPLAVAPSKRIVMSHINGHLLLWHWVMAHCVSSRRSGDSHVWHDYVYFAVSRGTSEAHSHGTWGIEMSSCDNESWHIVNGDLLLWYWVMAHSKWRSSPVTMSHGTWWMEISSCDNESWHIVSARRIMLRMDESCPMVSVRGDLRRWQG